MIKSLLIIIAVGATSFFYTDIKSTSTLYSAILPFVDFIVLVVLALWFIALFHKQGINQTTSSNNVDSNSFSGFDGGDGGDDGC